MNHRQDKLYQFINDFWIMFLRAPTLREIIDGTDLTSTSVVAKNLNLLHLDRRLFKLAKDKGAATPYMPLWVYRALRHAARAQSIADNGEVRH